MIVTKIIGCSLLTYTVCGIGISTIKSKKLTKEAKINNYRKSINISNNQDRTELYIKDEIKRITISDIKICIPIKDIDGYRFFENTEEARIFGENFYGEWYRNLTSKYENKNKYYTRNEDDGVNPYKALKLYSGNVYSGINSYLRYDYHNSIIDYLKDIIKNIDISFSNVPRTDENIIVFRRVHLCEELMNYYFSLKEGDMIKDKAYMSTSLILDIALNRGETMDPNCALLVIKVPEGENGIFIDEVDGYYEYEMLISKNRTLKLEKILVKNDTQIVLLCELQK